MENKENEKDFGLPEDKFEPVNTFSKKNIEKNKNSLIKYIVVISSGLSIILAISLILIFNKRSKLSIDESEIKQEDSSSLFEEEKENLNGSETSVENQEVDDSEKNNIDDIEDSTLKNTDEETQEENNRAVIDEETKNNLNEEVKDENNFESKSEGEIFFLKQPENSYFIILSSFIDIDLAKDFAQKLKKRGQNIYILSTKKNNLNFYRVSYSKYENKDEAQKELKNLKETYGKDIWLFKY